MFGQTVRPHKVVRKTGAYASKVYDSTSSIGWTGFLNVWLVPTRIYGDMGFRVDTLYDE